ncbi:MAG: SDR family NAD(P)-dependent oxidoreductase [Planctomycetota bacterium]|nr:MAG: SDR family NAD(P)-dependent oxidoreductase [Planctomycetota bacterium]REK24539.1 MAG: SDR family NAD(P)-dependent oxidoreductase [Planctomycetota bacterium]REK28781.1 MAG: SDR family NAD(P)-dependent oxidoreductase [Planctomycetota bacterium]
MEVRNRVIVVTGAAGGIGRALCRRFADEQAERVVVSDVDESAAQAVSSELGGLAIACDVSSPDSMDALVRRTIAECGRIDVFVSNAGVTSKGGVDLPIEDWQRCWDVNVMAHVHAARSVVPRMLERGEGYLVQVASAAGLLTEMGSAPYSTTKHAAVALAEWLAVHYQPRGIRVSCVCPAGVDTGFLNPDNVYDQFLKRTACSPEQVAEAVISTMREETFLALPHPEVGEFFAFKAQHYDEWLENFAKLNERMQRLAAKRTSKR